MKPAQWILFIASACFILALPVVWIVASLAADLRAFHPVAGWAIWVAAGVAVLFLLVPVIQFSRLPSMPPAGVWTVDGVSGEGQDWRQVAQLLANTCDDPDVAADLRRYMRDMPNDLPQAVRTELDRRRNLSADLRTRTIRQAAMLAFLSPHRQLDALILIWINLRQVYVLGRCYGFKPRPRTIIKLYAGVFGAAVAVEALDEVAEQTLADATTRLLGGVPLAGQAASLLYDPVRAAAYVGFIGLLAEHLLKNELKKPRREERGELRRTAWEGAFDAVSKIRQRVVVTEVVTKEAS